MTVNPLARLLRPHPCDGEILRLALPALGALAAEPLYILADTAIVGHLGTTALGGLALASTVLLLVYSIFIFLAYGTTAAVARLIGAGDERQAAYQAVQSMWLAALIGVTLVVIGLLATPVLVGVLGGVGGVAVNAEVYLHISLLGLPALLVTFAGIGYLRGLQDTRTPLAVATVSALANLLIEVIAIYGLGFGLAASAATTVIVQYGAMAVYLQRAGTAVRLHGVRISPHGSTIVKLMRGGSQLFIRTVALRGSLTVATAVAARTGPTGLAAYQITFEVWSFLALALDAVAVAAQTLIGGLLGSANVDQARNVGQRMLEWGFVAGIVGGVVVGALHSVLPHIFTQDDAVRQTASTLLLVAAVLQPINGLVFVLDGLLIGAGDMGYLAAVMVISTAVFVPAAGLIASLHLSVVWLWWALGLLMLTRLATLWVRWRASGWTLTGATR